MLGYIGHNLALLALPVALAAVALAGPAMAEPATLAVVTRYVGGANPGVNLSQALNVWIIQIVVAVGPPLGGLVFIVYMKTDWGISLFFLTPLALVAIPSLRIQKIALFYLSAIWLVITLAVLAASPNIAAREMAENPNGASGYGARSQLARELTQAWHTRFGSRWAVVAGTTEVGEPMTFYSPDHPAPFTPGEIWSSGLTSLEEAKRLGFIGICDTSDRPAAGLRRLDGGQCRKCRATRHDHAALFQRPSRSGDRPGKSISRRRRNEAVSFRTREASDRSSLRIWSLRITDDGDQVPSSLNLLATSSVIAVERGFGLGAGGGDHDVVPGPADSIISPMIEVPPTVSLPRVTQTSALKRSTICTNFADARACRPRLLMMGSSRDIAPGGMLGPAWFSGGVSSSLICRRERGWRW